jgi:hypothetical protein
MGKFITIVFIKAIFGPEPHKATAIFNDGYYMALGKAFVCTKLFKFKIACLRMTQSGKKLA